MCAILISSAFSQKPLVLDRISLIKCSEMSDQDYEYFKAPKRNFNVVKDELKICT